MHATVAIGSVLALAGFAFALLTGDGTIPRYFSYTLLLGAVVLVLAAATKRLVRPAHEKSVER